MKAGLDGWLTGHKFASVVQALFLLRDYDEDYVRLWISANLQEASDAESFAMLLGQAGQWDENVFLSQLPRARRSSVSLAAFFYAAARTIERVDNRTEFLRQLTSRLEVSEIAVLAYFIAKYGSLGVRNELLAAVGAEAEKIAAIGWEVAVSPVEHHECYIITGKSIDATNDRRAKESLEKQRGVVHSERQFTDGIPMMRESLASRAAIIAAILEASHTTTEEVSEVRSLVSRMTPPKEMTIWLTDLYAKSDNDVSHAGA